MTDPALRYGLALHTSTPELGLAIAPVGGYDGAVSTATESARSQVWDLGYELSSRLHPLLQGFIQPISWRDIALLAVARGPGGFTGTRVGVVTARTLAQQLGVPLMAVSSLAAVALRDALAHSGSDADIAVEMPARRGQVFGAIYRPGASPAALAAAREDSVMDQAAWGEILQDWRRPYRRVDASGRLGATAEQVLAIAIAQWQQGERPHWGQALPFYGQSPV